MELSPEERQCIDLEEKARAETEPFNQAKEVRSSK